MKIKFILRYLILSYLILALLTGRAEVVPNKDAAVAGVVGPAVIVGVGVAVVVER